MTGRPRSGWPSSASTQATPIWIAPITILASASLHGKKYAEAIQTFQTLLGKYPAFSNAESAQYNLGIARYQAAVESKKAEDFKAAAVELAALAGKYPQGQHTAAALYYQGESLLAAADARGAMEAYKKLLAGFPTSTWAPEACYALGTAQQEAGQDSDADRHLPEIPGQPHGGRRRSGDRSAAAAGAVAGEAEEVRRGGAAFAAAAAAANFAGADLALLRQGQCRLQMGKPAEAAEVLADAAAAIPQQPVQAGSRSWRPAGATSRSGKLAEAQKLLEPLAKGQGREAGRGRLLAGADPAEVVQAAGGPGGGRERAEDGPAGRCRRPTWS